MKKKGGRVKNPVDRLFLKSHPQFQKVGFLKPDSRRIFVQKVGFLKPDSRRIFVYAYVGILLLTNLFGPSLAIYCTNFDDFKADQKLRLRAFQRL